MANNKSNCRLIFGALLIFFGLIFFGENLDLFSFDLSHYIFRWQSILILIGLITLANNRNNGTGYILILIGGGSLVANYYDYSLMEVIDDYWPIILIAIGFYIIYKRGDGHHSKKKKSNTDFTNSADDYNETQNNFNSCFDGKCNNTKYTEVDDNMIDISAIFSTQKSIIKSQNFSGGKTTSIFGGIDLDFRDAKLAPGTNVIDTFTMFGGTEIIVPKEWKLSVNVVVLFGGVDDKRDGRIDNVQEDGSTLVLKGLTIFGGTEIKYV